MWQTEMVKMVRTLISDMDTTNDDQRYSDERLQQVILTAAQLVQTDVRLHTTYTIDVDEFLLSPDPTDYNGGSRDNPFMNLIVLKAACFVDSMEARLAAGQAITIRDGSSMISLGGAGGMLDGALKIWQNGACLSYKTAVDAYIRGQVDTAGMIVLSAMHCRDPFWRSYPCDGRYR